MFIKNKPNAFDTISLPEWIKNKNDKKRMLKKRRGQYLFGGIDILSTSAIFADDEINLINDRLKNISFAKNHCGGGQTIVLFTHHSEGNEICRTEKNPIQW